MADFSKVYVTLTQYFIFLYYKYIYMYLQDMRFLWAMFSLGQLYTDDDTNDDDDAKDDNDDTKDDDTRRTNHDYTGS